MNSKNMITAVKLSAIEDILDSIFLTVEDTEWEGAIAALKVSVESIKNEVIENI